MDVDLQDDASTSQQRDIPWSCTQVGHTTMSTAEEDGSEEDGESEDNDGEDDGDNSVDDANSDDE